MAVDYDQIGSAKVNAWREQIPPQRKALADATRVGVDGTAAADMGLKVRRFTLTGSADYANKAGVNSALATFAAAVGTTVAIKKDGVTHSDYHLMDVELVESRYTESATGGPNGGQPWWATFRFTFEKAGVS